MGAGPSPAKNPFSRRPLTAGNPAAILSQMEIHAASAPLLLSAAKRLPMMNSIGGTTSGFAGLVEFSPQFRPRPQISHVLFDFDGTLSLIRQGWPEVMVPMFVEMLPRQAGESEDDARRLVFEDIMRLNGKQTIYQMIQLAERIRQRGGQTARAAVVQARVPAAARPADRRPDRGPAQRADPARRTARLRRPAAAGAAGGRG